MDDQPQRLNDDTLPDRPSGLESAEPASDVQPDVELEPSVTTMAAKETWVFEVQRFGRLAIATSCLWLAVTSFLMGRLAWEWWQLDRLRRRAMRAESATIRVCRELASQLGLTAPDVLQSPFLPSPCLTGLRRPAILMPDTEMSLSLRDVLDKLLGPMELTYRVVDESTVQITTRQAVDSHPELEFYAVGDVTEGSDGPAHDIEQLIPRITEAVGVSHFASGDGISWDPTSQCLMVLLPQPQQTIVGEFLEDMRSAR